MSKPAHHAESAEPQAFFSGVSEHWGDGSTISTGTALVAIGLVLAIVGMLSVWTWWRDRSLVPAPLRTFSRAAGACGITWSDRWLLYRVARRERLPTPLTLLLSPMTLRHHGQAWAGGRAARLRRVASLRRRVFGPSGPGAAP